MRRPLNHTLPITSNINYKVRKHFIFWQKFNYHIL